MKYLLILFIRLYWVIIPKRNRRPCLFKETCSHFVYRQTKELGFFEGTKALLSRYKKCRRGYKLKFTHHGFVLELVDGTILQEEDISQNIIEPVKNRIESQLKDLLGKNYHPCRQETTHNKKGFNDYIIQQ